MKPLLFFSFWILLGQVCSHSFPSCPGTRKRANETWLDDFVELRCSETPNGKLEVVVIACYAIIEHPAPAIRIPVGTSQLVPLQGLKKCVETSPGVGELVAVPSKCNNSREEGEEWEEGSFVKGCELDRSSKDKYEAVVFIKACIVEGHVIPVGTSKSVSYGTAFCKRYDEIPAGVDPSLVPVRFVGVGGIGIPQELDLATIRCENGKRQNETWEEGSFVKGCQLDRSVKGKYEAVIVIKACIHDGVTIPVGESRPYYDGQATCKRVDVIPEGVDASLVPVRIAYVGGYGGRPAEDVLAPTEEDESKCDNGRMPGEEWELWHRVYLCEKNTDFEDSEGFVAVVKACVVGGTVIPIGEKGNVTYEEDGVKATCECVRSDGFTGRFQVRSATMECLGLLEEPITTTTASPSRSNRPNCKDAKNLNKEVVEDKFVKACKKVRLSKTVTDIKFITIRCITPAGDEVAVGKKKSTAEGVYDCQRLTYGRAKLSFSERTLSTTPLPIVEKCENGKSVGEEWVDEENKLIKSCVLDPRLTADATTVIIVKACFIDEYEIPVGEAIEEMGMRCECQRASDDHELVVYARRAALVCFPVRPNCQLPENLDKEVIDGSYVKACKNNNVGNNVTLVQYLRIRCFTPERDVIEVGTSLRTAAGWYHCERVHHSDGGMELKFEDAKESTQEPTTTKPSTKKPFKKPNCKDPKNLGKEIDCGNFVRACKKVTAYGKPDIRFYVVRCITPEGAKIALGKSASTATGTYTCKKRAHGMARLDFVKKPTTPSPQSTTPTPTCANGLRLGEVEMGKDFVRICNWDLLLQVTFCKANYEGFIFPVAVGDTVRFNGTQYSCERRGELDAELVQKSFSQLCEEGDLTVDAWFADGVLRDCVRTGAKPIVYARMCKIEDTLVEVGQNLVHEFITYRCEVKGDFDAQVAADTSRIHPTYFNTPGACMNGKKEGDEWTDRGVLRACRKGGPQPTVSGQPVIVDLGCIRGDNGDIVPVGGRARWNDDGNVDEILICEKGENGFGAIAKRGHSKEVRACENDRVEGEEWEDRNVLRTCKEVNDELAVVALRCVLGNETLEIGENKITSDVSSVECVRVGDHDAALIIDLARPFDKVCENGKQLNEEWTDNQSRKTCRIRKSTATIVLIGCQLEDGRLFAIGEKETQTHARPGYEEYHTTHCVSEDGGVNGRVYKTTARSNERQDEKSPCGENKHGAVWAKERFLKKCEVIEGNVLSGVTIGCVTLKYTHMLVGQTLEEDEYHISCVRNEDGKIAMHYSFSIKEEAKPYHNHPH